MIPFASERGLGQDLATHLLNSDQNEYVEIAYVKGAVARDLHGAFAEWEVQAKTLTKCKNYLYSMSINPDQTQGQLTRDQYLDFIARVEKKLGLEGQPSAAVFHIKEGREHCHVVWSKIDVAKEKAVHLAFDHDKLMAVTRQFSREHNLVLPDGYHKEGRSGKDQLTLYEKAQERTSGISKAEKVEQITDAWRRSDSPKAFVQALAEKGYVLAQGRRPYVVVDFYGGMAALPKMIDDKSIKTDDIRTFLADEFPSESLPTVEEAKALVAEYRKSMEAYFKHEQKQDQIDVLKRKQQERREALQQENRSLRDRQAAEKASLLVKQKQERDALRSRHLKTLVAVKNDRRKLPQAGLSGFLGKITGVNLIRKKLQKNHDKKLVAAYREERAALRSVHASQRQAQESFHEFQGHDINRRLKALDQVEKRELRTLKESLTRETRLFMRRGRPQMPALNFDLSPPGRKAVPHKAINRHKNKSLEEKFGQARDHKTADIDLKDAFARASGEEDAGGGNEGHGSSLSPYAPRPVERYVKPAAPRGGDKDRER